MCEKCKKNNKKCGIIAQFYIKWKIICADRVMYVKSYLFLLNDDFFPVSL